METIELIDMEIPWFFQALSFVLGACVGSFLNVVIFRLPKGESLVHPGSHCACGAAIPFYRNIPILSWFLLLGRAPCCKGRISFRYPLVETLTALIFLACWRAYPPPVALVFMLFAAMMVTQAFIDLDTMEIPDAFSVGGFIIGLVVSAAVPLIHGFYGDLWVVDGMRGLIVGLQGAFVGSALILWIAVVAEMILRKEAMGFGDVKLMGAIGAFCGWEGAVFAIFGGAVLGSVAVLLIAVFGRLFGVRIEEFGARDRDLSDESGSVEDPGIRIPFGPALAAGALIYLLFLHRPVDAFFADFSRSLFL